MYTNFLGLTLLLKRNKYISIEPFIRDEFGVMFKKKSLVNKLDDIARRSIYIEYGQRGTNQKAFNLGNQKFNFSTSYKSLINISPTK